MIVVLKDLSFLVQWRLWLIGALALTNITGWLANIGLPDPDPGAKSSSNPADFGAVFWSVDPF